MSRPGIRSRHLAAADVGARDLARVAAERAIEAAGCEADDIDLIIVATSTPDYIFPSTAALVQSKLGIRNGGPAFDVQVGGLQRLRLCADGRREVHPFGQSQARADHRRRSVLAHSRLV